MDELAHLAERLVRIEEMRYFGGMMPDLRTLLDEALALPAAERTAWLESLTDERAPLRDTLRGLLAAHGDVETGTFLATPPELARAGDAALDDVRLAAGDMIGPYRLIAELGSGGMGTVWLAERSDGQLKRQVALKLPHLTWGGALAERLSRERDILASLEHPHIARLYDAGVDRQGRPYLAMEYVDGQTIDVYCNQRALPLGDRLGLLLQVAAAVAHAHARLVVHRDLKPGNILVTADGQVRLLDFGIAKLMDVDRTEESSLTLLSGRALTPEYASPEQIRREPLSTASDVYSLAVVAYELLAGARPYRLKRASVAELEEAITSIDPPLASEATSRAGTTQAAQGGPRRNPEQGAQEGQQPALRDRGGTGARPASPRGSTTGAGAARLARVPRGQVRQPLPLPGDGRRRRGAGVAGGCRRGGLAGATRARTGGTRRGGQALRVVHLQGR